MTGHNLVLRHVLMPSEAKLVRKEMHDNVAGGHFSQEIITKKILDGEY